MTLLAACLGWLSAAALGADTIPARTAVTAGLQILVGDRGAAADTIVADAEGRGGWFALRTPDLVVTRVPVAEVDAHVEAIVAQGLVLERSLSRQDVSRAVAEVRSRIETREQVLARYEEALDRAEPESVVAVERRIGTEISAIESFEGQRQVLEDQAAYARVEVLFHFRDRTAPEVTKSPFSWIDTLEIWQVRAMWQHEWGWRTRGVTVETPDGFARWWSQRRYRATSPDGVSYRVRTVPHRPRATLPFWQEAVREHLQTTAGYTVLSDQALTVDGQPGALFAFAAPTGDEDLGLIVAIVPVGRKLVIAEATGALERVEAHREAIVASIASLELP